jgi:hypothetical protein
VGEDQLTGVPGVADGVADDLDVEDPPVPGPVAPAGGGVEAALHVAGDPKEPIDLLGRPDLLDGHREELLARVAVLLDGGVVHGDEAQRVDVEEPHGVRAPEEGGVLTRVGPLPGGAPGQGAVSERGDRGGQDRPGDR